MSTDRSEVETTPSVKVETELPSFPNFTPLSLAHQAFLSRYARRFPPYSDHNFTSYWCWRVEDGDPGHSTWLSLCNGNVVVRTTDYLSGSPALTFFGTSEVADTVRILLDHLAQAGNSVHQLSLIPEYTLSSAQLPETIRIELDRDNCDYVFDTEALASMRGARYEAHRNFLNRFKKLYAFQARPLDLQSAAEWEALWALFERWAAGKAEEGMSVECDRNALDHLRELIGRVQLVGLGLYIDGALCGYTINELLHDGHSVNLFEHADKRFAGIFRKLKQVTAAHLLELGYRAWNHQQDSGLLGLRKSKLSFHPTCLLNKYRLTRYT